jgi:CHAT domain-containing protein
MRNGGAARPDSHGIGVWRLVMGHADDAVADLRDAAQREPSNARVLNDLAVGLTELAEARDDPSTLIDAFTAADSAVRLDASLPEAQFTLAMLLEQLYLPSEAIAAWTRYLELDGKSPWADEARASLAKLAPRDDQSGKARERLRTAASTSDLQTIAAIVAAYPSETRLEIQDQLGAWGRAIVAGDTARGRSFLDHSRALAEPLRTTTGDALMSDAVAAIDRASNRGDHTRFRVLAEGHVALADGIEGLGNRNFAKAGARLATARRLLTLGVSPMNQWASLSEARLQLLEVKYSDALVTFNAIRDVVPARHVVLRSMAAQYVGFIYDTRSDYVHAVAAYDSALAESRTTGEPQITLRVGGWLSRTAAVLRGRDAGWRALYSALAATPRYSMNDRAAYSVFDNAALATANEAPRLSLRYCNVLVQIGDRLSDAATASVAFRRRAEQLLRMGESDQARADIDAAMTIAQKIENATVRTQTIADVTLASAHVALHSAPREAEPALRRVVDVYRGVHYEMGLGTAYLYLAQSRVASGMLASARAAFDSATDLLQRQRETVSDAAERAAFLDDARATIDQITAFHAGHNANDAFEYFERTRSRVLLEQLTVRRADSSSPATTGGVLDALQRRLSPSDVVLSYAVLPRETLIWTIGRDRFELHRVPVPASEIQNLVTRLQRSVRDRATGPDTVASDRLRQLLIANAGPIPRGANLIVIPDRWLHFVPFVALRDASTGRFLVQDHSVSFAPSATLLIAGLHRLNSTFSHSTKVLAVGNPTFDSRVFQLAKLPAAEREARAVAELYDHQSAVVGAAATDVAVERMAPRFDILHFAAHAVVGRNAPQLSHLVLASDGHSTGAVFASEIAQWRLPRTKLVILSGCSTGDGKLSATEGTSSLARAFFAAGVPAVISSLWAIDDNDTADFFIAFHRRLAQGEPAAIALRETQIEWLGDGHSRAHPVSSWASFELFGG